MLFFMLPFSGHRPQKMGYRHVVCNLVGAWYDFHGRHWSHFFQRRNRLYESRLYLINRNWRFGIKFGENISWVLFCIFIQNALTLYEING